MSISVKHYSHYSLLGILLYAAYTLSTMIAQMQKQAPSDHTFPSSQRDSLPLPSDNPVNSSTAPGSAYPPADSSPPPPAAA
jgi:hypothetical protein